MIVFFRVLKEEMWVKKGYTSVALLASLGLLSMHPEPVETRVLWMAMVGHDLQLNKLKWLPVPPFLDREELEGGPGVGVVLVTPEQDGALVVLRPEPVHREGFGSRLQPSREREGPGWI